MRLHSDLTHTKQYRANIGVALSWLEATDSVLNEVGQALQRVKELAVYGANGVLPQDARDAIAREVDQILEHLVDLANSSHAGLYLFGGHRTTTPPYVLSGGTVSYQGDTEPGRRELEIASGVKIAVNVLGSELFDQIFQAVTNLRDALYEGDTATVGNQSLAEVEDALDTLLRVRADVGARINRLELADARMQELELNVEQLISDNEDVDLARAIIDLKVAENVYRAALASGARIIQPTLLDFLR